MYVKLKRMREGGGREVQDIAYIIYYLIYLSKQSAEARCVHLTHCCDKSLNSYTQDQYHERTTICLLSCMSVRNLLSPIELVPLTSDEEAPMYVCVCMEG